MILYDIIRPNQLRTFAKFVNNDTGTLEQNIYVYYQSTVEVGIITAINLIINNIRNKNYLQ